MKGEYKKSSSHTLNATSSFCNRSQAYFFLLFLEPRDKRKASQRNLYCLLEIRVEKIFFRIVGAWSWESAILSTAPRICQHEWRHLTNQSMIPDHEQRHQRHVSRLRHPFRLPRTTPAINRRWQRLECDSHCQHQDKRGWILVFEGERYCELYISVYPQSTYAQDFVA